MSQELEEKVARAISPFWFTEDGSPPIINNYPDQHLHYQEKARVAARAALAVVREEMAEPSEEMLFAADWLENGTREAWKAMLSASPIGEQ